jgi:hypothetical protein
MIAIPKVKMTASVTTERKFRVELTAKHLLAMLAKQGQRIPSDAKITFHVPGGGDYSNMAIDIDDEKPVYVEWKTESVETESR